MTSRAASGAQFELRRGPARARIGQVAAVLREFSVGGVRYTETWPDDQTPPMGCGIVLMPWPNRVAGGRWTHQGKPLQFDLTEPDKGNAIHGLLRNAAYQPVPDDNEIASDPSSADTRRPDASERDAVTLAATVYPQHGWPFTLDTAVTYALTEQGLRVTHRVTNVGAMPAVFGCGAHPYLRVGDVPTEQLTVTVHAATRAVVDERMIPIRWESVAGTDADLRGGASLAGRVLDVGLGELQPVDGRFEHRLTAPDGRGLLLWADPAFRWAQVFTPQAFPAPEGPRPAIAIEPMTCPANALGSGDGLIELAPGETWNASWGLTPFAE